MNQLTTQQNATLPARPSALPENWIARLFDQMTGLYGSKLADLWAGSDPATVRRVWGESLAGFYDKPEAIKAALSGLDSKPFPPTLPEFKQMCRDEARRIGNDTKAIEYKPTKEEQERAAQMIEKAAKAVSARDTRDHRQWVDALIERREAGEILSAAQESAIREASKVAA